MIKINEESLLFKLNKVIDSPSYRQLIYTQSTSLCEYFWYGCLGGLAVTIVCLGLLGVGYLIVCALVFLTGPYTGWWGFVNMSEIGGMIVIFALVVVGTTGWFWGLPIVPNWIKYPFSKLLPENIESKDQPVKVSIILEYYKAYKEKWCPVIVLDKEKDDE